MLPTIYLNRQEIGTKTYYYATFKFNRNLYHLFTRTEGIEWDKQERSFRFDIYFLPLEKFEQIFADQAEFEQIEQSLVSVEYKKA